MNASWYDYGYDLLGRLTQADYGGDVASMADYTRSYTYDLNGNMTGREYIQYGERWTHDVGNAPLSWTCDEPAPPGPPPGLRSGPPPVEDVLEEMYTYDANGSLMTVRDDQGDTLRVTRYNLLNLPEEYANASGGTVNYVYSADGEKLYVEENPSGGAVQGTEYAANYRIDNGAVTMIHTDAGYYTPVTAQGGSGVSYSHVWYLKDHLGNNRVMADGRGYAVKFVHYDPYGTQVSIGMASTVPFPSDATESPYKYGGKEWNATTSTYDFEARQFSPDFHRFTTIDPLAEKYYSISPYAFCAGNPVNLVDPEGQNPVVYRVICAAISAGADFGIQIGVKMLEGDNFNGAFKKVDWTSVGGSLVTGLVDPKKALGKVVIGVVSVADAAIDSSIDDRFRVVGHPNEEKAKSVADAAIDLSVGLSGVAGGEKVTKVVEDGFNKEAENKAIATLTKQGKQQARNRAKIAAKEGVKIAEKQAVSLSAKGVGEVGKQMLVEPAKEPLRLQFQQGYNYNPSSFGYVF